MHAPPLPTVIRAGLVCGLIVPVLFLAQDIPAASTAANLINPDAMSAITKKELVRDQRFTLKGWKGEIKDAWIVDLAGNDIAGILAPKTENGAVTMALPIRPFVIKSRLPQAVAWDAQSETMLPGGLVLALSAAPDRGGPAKAIWFRLFCSVSPRPAPWNESSGTYVTEMKFTVRATEGSPPSVALPYPVAISLEYDGMTAQDIPNFTIEQAGIEHQKVVELRFRPSTLQPKLMVRSTISDSDLPIEALPRLELRPARTAVLGFGLETVAVTVAQVQADGEPMAAKAPLNVDVQVHGAARLEGTGDVVILAGGSRAEFVFRSSGLGKITVEATVGALTATTELSQRFPTGPLVAALAGGALGGLARRWVKGARKRSAARRVLEGAVVGLVAFVAAVLGVGYLHLPAAIAATEAGAFLTSVLCGFVGVAVFTALIDRLNAGAEK
jgi:hypothetical protein